MTRFIVACAGLLVLPLAKAQEITATWIELPVAALPTTEPPGLVELSKGAVTRVSGQNEISTTMSQPVKFEYRLIEEFPLFVRYQGEARLQTIEDPLTNFNLGNRLDIAHTTALVAEFSKTFTATFLVESRNILPQDAMLQWANRAEVIAKKIKLFGKVDLTTTTGISELGAAGGATLAQQYLKLQAEQRIADGPFRVRLAPTLVQETSQGETASTRTLTGMDSAVLLDATAQTTLSLGASYASRLSLDDETSQRSFYTQLEQMIMPGAAIRLRANYEEGTVKQVLNEAAMAFLVETSFSLTQTLRGGFQLQHHVRELLSTSESVPETILSLSLGGSF